MLLGFYKNIFLNFLTFLYYFLKVYVIIIQNEYYSEMVTRMIRMTEGLYGYKYFIGKWHK